MWSSLKYIRSHIWRSSIYWIFTTIPEWSFDICSLMTLRSWGRCFLSIRTKNAFIPMETIPPGWKYGIAVSNCDAIGECLWVSSYLPVVSYWHSVDHNRQNTPMQNDLWLSDSTLDCKSYGQAFFSPVSLWLRNFHHSLFYWVNALLILKIHGLDFEIAW